MKIIYKFMFKFITWGNNNFEHSNILISPFRVEADKTLLLSFFLRNNQCYSQFLEITDIEVCSSFVKIKENTKGE